MALDLIALRGKRSKVVNGFFKENIQESTQKGTYRQPLGAIRAVNGEANNSSSSESNPQSGPKTGGENSERSPLLIQMTQMTQVQSEPESESEPSPLAIRHYSILIVDDDDDNLLFAHYAVEQFGYHVAAARSGKEAIATAFSFCPDIILLDLMLDDLSGAEVLQHLRQHKQFGAVPMIAVTALAHDRDRDSALSAGFSDYLIKPYMLDDLEAMIKRHLPS